jgi:Pectate lyase superfamily protein
MRLEASPPPFCAVRVASRPTSTFLINASLAVLASSSLLLIGCGLTINANSSTASSTPVTIPSDPGGAGGQVSPFPGAFQPLTGCTNPNTGTASGDWGVATPPVYTTVNNTDPIVGAPIYKSNAIFWTSHENAPGQSILLSGAFTDATKKARIAVIPVGTGDWQSLVKASATLVPTIQQGTTGLSFTIPAGFAAGIYGFEIEDPTAPAVMGLANQPALGWAIGVPLIVDATMALRHQVHDCGVEPGGALRIFGKNFIPSNQVVLQSSSGVAYSLVPSRLDPTSVIVSIPAAINPGTYNVWVGSLPWSITSSPAGQIAVVSPLSLTPFTVTCSKLVGDGVTDNTKNLQSCLDLYAPIGSREVAYIAVPAGTFLLKGPIQGRSFEVLAGSSPTLTKFIGQPPNSPPSAWITAPNYFGLINLSFQAPANPNLLISTGTLTGNPVLSGHLFFDNINFSSTSDASNGAEMMFLLAGPDIQVYNSSFLSNSNQVFDILFGDGAFVSGNNFTLNNWTGIGISDSQNIIFESNSSSSQNTPVPGTTNAGSGLSVSRGNSLYGQSALSRDIYIGYNTFQHMGSDLQQIITNDGDGGSYFGPIASSTTNTLTLADDPNWNWMGTSNPQAAVVVIAFGTGVGQYSFLKSYSGRTLTLSTPLAVLPDSTSVVGVFQYEQNMTIAHNDITNTLGGSIVLADALEGIIEDNSMTNSGQGILISAFGPYGGPAALGPVMNTDVLRNTLSLGAGDLINRDQGLYIWGIGIQDFPGCLVSGLMVRDNTVPGINVIYNTDGVNGISANVIEQNRAYWSPTFPTPGFLVQNNTPPPE